MTPPILVGLHRGTGIVARLIRWQTRSVYSHASIRFDDIVYEAGPKGFGWLHVTEVQGHVDWFQVAAGEEAGAHAYGWCLANSGRPYDWWSVLRFVVWIRTLIGGGDTKRALFCSEAVTRALNSAGVPPLRRIKPHQVAPAHLAWSPLLTEWTP